MIYLSEGEKTSEITKAEAEASSKEMIANSEREVKLQQTEAIALSIERIAKAISDNPHGMDAVQYLLAQKYLEMGQAIGQSPSSKVLFMDPKSIPAAIQSLLSMSDSFNGGKSGNEGNVTQPFGAASNIPPIFNNFPEIQNNPPKNIDNIDPSKN